MQILNKKLKLAGAAMKPLSKMLLGHEAFTSIILWAMSEKLKTQ